MTEADDAMQSGRARAVRQLAIEAMVGWLFDELRGAGVHPLLLKGLSTHRWLYGPDELPQSSDIDLLVAPGEFASAERRLQELGMVNRFDGPAPEWAEEHGDRWDHESWPVPVDLHRRLWELGADPEQVWSVMAQCRDTLDVAGRRVDIPNEPMRALLVALHAAHHGVAVEKPRLELKQALAVVDGIAWGEASALAERLRCVPQLVQGLRLVPDGHALVNQLGLEHVAEPVPFVAAHLFDAPTSTEGFVRVAAAGSWPERLRLIWRELFPSRTFMRLRSSHAGVARKGHGGLILAYCLRWAHLARNSAAGLRAASTHRGNRRR